MLSDASFLVEFRLTDSTAMTQSSLRWTGRHWRGGGGAAPLSESFGLCSPMADLRRHRVMVRMVTATDCSSHVSCVPKRQHPPPALCNCTRLEGRQRQAGL